MIDQDGAGEARKNSVASKARMLAAKLTENIAKNFIQPHKEPLVTHTLIIVSVFQVDDEKIVSDAIERGKKRAESNKDSKVAKVFFGALRFLGFGFIEATGNGGVEYSKQEGCDDIYVITTSIEVRVESTESLAMTVATLGDRLQKLPPGVVCALTGVPVTKAKLVSVAVDML